MRMPADKAANAPVFEIDPEFGEMAVRMGQATWSITELSQREKVFACVAADVCVRDLGLPLQMHMEMALANDVPIQDVREVILQSAIEAGHTGTLMALARFNEICSALSKSVPRTSTGAGSEDQFDYFSRPSTDELDRELSRMWSDIIPVHWSRGGLSRKERIFISLTANVLQGIFGKPFLHHVRLARTIGATDAQMRALFRFLSEYGFSRSWVALDVLASVPN